MSTPNSAARVGAAAFVMGVALVGPLAGQAPVATADSPDSSVASRGDSSETAKPARTARGPKAVSPRSNRDRSTAPRAASTGDAVGHEIKAPARRSSRIQSAVVSPTTTAVAVSDLPAATPASEPAVAAAPTAPMIEATEPAALATVSTPGANATSLSSSFRGLFEGAALLWRRRLFNEAPDVSPVQLTGLRDGPITGSIGAVDPEGDPLVYAVTGDPRFGTVTISQDGSYTYIPGADFGGSDNFVVAVTDTGWHINLLNLRRPTSTEASVSVAQGEQAPLLRFQFVYDSGAQFWSSEARAALESAAASLAGYFAVTAPVTVTYAVTGQFAPLSGTLASAGSEFIDPGAGFMPTVVQKKIQTGIDGNGAAADGEITWNFGPPWGYGNVANTQYDFQSTAMHEILHTLGFLSYGDRAGSNTGQTWTIYDSYLVNSDGAAVIGGNYKWNTAYNTNLTGGNGGLYFGGPSAVAAYGGLVPLYTPFPYASGSSLSHLNDGSFTGANEKLMTAVSGQGTGVRVLSPLELGILADIGYQLNPASGSSTLMFVGFFFSRRPRRKANHAPQSASATRRGVPGARVSTSHAHR